MQPRGVVCIKRGFKPVWKLIVFKWEIRIATCARLWVPMGAHMVFMGVQMGAVGVQMGVHGCSWVCRWVYMGVLLVFKAWCRP